MADVVSVRILVEGRVQGVWFRESTRREAERLNVAGWVRNLSDGRVEALFEGDPAAVESMIAWAAHGPERAVVTRLERIDQTPQGLATFRVM